MLDATLYDQHTAPEAARPMLEDSIKAFGMVPNLHAVMAESPQLLELYKQSHQAFLATSFSVEEKTVIWQTINTEHECHYCVPAHSMIAESMGVDKAIDDALRNNTPLPDARLEALRTFTRAMLINRGNVDDATMQAFLAAGFEKKNVFEVLVGLAQKVMSNYTNHLAETPVDAPFQKYTWDKAA